MEQSERARRPNADVELEVGRHHGRAAPVRARGHELRVSGEVAGVPKDRATRHSVPVERETAAVRAGARRIARRARDEAGLRTAELGCEKGAPAPGADEAVQVAHRRDDPAGGPDAGDADLLADVLEGHPRTRVDVPAGEGARQGE